MRRKFEFNAIERDSIGVGFTVGLYGFSFGAIAHAAHASTWQAMCLSSVLFSGGSQFALVGALAEGSSALSAVAVALFLGIRNALYAVRLQPITKHYSMVKRFIAGHITIDESAAMATAQERQPEARMAFWATGFGVFVFWNLFTLLGALGAKAIGNTSAWGLDVASPAIFCAVLYPRLKERSFLFAALLAFIWALSITEFVPAGVPIISTVVIAAVLGWK